MMRPLLLLIFLVASLPAWSAPVTVLVMGDSLSAAYGIDRDQGWVALLRERLAARGFDATVVNASTSGNTTRAGLARLDESLRQHDPDVVIIALGGNDGLRGVPLETMRRNLSRMVEQSRQAGARVLLVGVRLPTNYGSAFIERFQATFRQVAQEYDIPLVPKFLAGVAENPELMQDDGIHPGVEAQPLMLDNIWPKLEPLLR
jgi:acyl-CoA thioesterase-1